MDSLNCAECVNYSKRLLERNEIHECEQLAIIDKRHSLGICASHIDPFVKWLEFAIINQEQLLREHQFDSEMQWNKGYLEALLDVKERYNNAKEL